jgi:hypothetical protein
VIGTEVVKNILTRGPTETKLFPPFLAPLLNRPSHSLDKPITGVRGECPLQEKA